jgi:hypothetical protein
MGVINGTSNSRGVRALRASRRRVRVVNALQVAVGRGSSRRTTGGVAVIVDADIVSPRET